MSFEQRHENKRNVPRINIEAIDKHDKQLLLSLHMKTKVVQHVPRITHVTQMNHWNHVTLTGSKLLFDFQTFLVVNRRNEFFIFSKQSVQYRKKHIMWHFSKLKKAKLISVFNLVFLSLSDRNKSLFSFSPVRDNLLLV